jgi:hypothetical protein
VVIGHVVRDLVPGGWRLGGTAAFAAVQAQRLGLRAGIVTRMGAEMSLPELLPEVAVAGRPARCTTTFENVYDGWRRRQQVPEQAEPLGEDDVAPGWREAPVVLLGPVCGEVPAEVAMTFASPLLGVSAQGWLRKIDAGRNVRVEPWHGAPFWAGATVVFASDEDLGEHPEQADRWSADVPLVVVTKARRGAEVRRAGRRMQIEGFPAEERDPTGAGDVFAAAFLVRYRETDDVAEAARFAAAAAAWSVEGAGTEHVADRAAIEERMRAHPEIRLR